MRSAVEAVGGERGERRRCSSPPGYVTRYFVILIDIFLPGSAITSKYLASLSTYILRSSKMSTEYSPREIVFEIKKKNGVKGVSSRSWRLKTKGTLESGERGTLNRGESH